MIKSEGKIEAAAVKGAIKELESLQKVQRAAHSVCILASPDRVRC